MSTDSYQENSISWQFRQWQQQISEWLELQTQRLSPNVPDWDWSMPSWLESPILWVIMQLLFWLILAFLLSWIVLQILNRLQPYLQTKLHSLDSQKLTTNLPDTSINYWLKQSQKFQQQGNYYEACRCLYLAMLQQLHDRGIISHQRSRTDGEYVQLIQNIPKSQPYQTLLHNHQQLCFGKTEADSNILEECQQAYQDLSTN